MTTTPDPKTVQQLATEHILDDARRAHDIGADVLGHFGPDALSKVEYHAYCDAVREAITTATIAVSWPAEQPRPADTTRVDALRHTDDTPDAERLAQIRDRNRRLAAVPFETHGGGHGPGCIPCELVRAVDDVRWLLERVAHLDTARDSAVRAWKTEHDGADELQRERDDARAQLRTEADIAKALLQDKNELIMRAHHAEVARDQARDELAKVRDELAETRASQNPLLRCLIIKAAPDRDLYIGWSNVVEAPTGIWTRAEAEAYGFPRSRLDRADRNGTSSMVPGSGQWDDIGFIAEQRGWLRRDRIGDYAQAYAREDYDAAWDLLEPFEGETEVRRG